MNPLGEEPKSYEGRVTALHSAWDVDRHIVLASSDKLVLVRFSSYVTPPDEVVFEGLETENTVQFRGSDEDETDELQDQLDGLEGGVKTQQKSRATSNHRSECRKRGRESLSTPRKEERRRRSSAPALAGTAHYLNTQKIDLLLEEMAPKVRKYCTIFTVDTNEVPEFNSLYELGHDRDPFAILFFYRNAHIKVDVGTGNTNKINFYAFESWRDLVDIVNEAYKAGRMGKYITSIEKSYSTAGVRR